jgi:putative ABC transport system permease protein
MSSSTTSGFKSRIAVAAASTALFLGLGAIALLVGGIGIADVMVIAGTRHWTLLIPPASLWGGLAVAITVAGIAGLYPAVRAARLPPTEALRTI